MKKQPSKIILNLFLIMLIGACHTLEHNGFKLKPKNENIVHKEIKDKDINYNNIVSTSEKIILSKKIRQMAPEKLKKPSKLLPIKKLKKTKLKEFNLISILKLSELELFKELGESDFVKFEGKLKNHQYYFNKCFLDVFVLNKGNTYYVDLVQTRPITLNGTLNTEECLQDINKKISIFKK